MNLVDRLLNSITMYRTVLYGLYIMAGYAIFLSFLKAISFSPIELIISLSIVIIVCLSVNFLLAKLFRAAINAESSYITALILFFLLWPSIKIDGILLISAAAAFAIGSKYVFTYHKKHIFNPAAIGAVFLAFFNSGALWWTATISMLPITLIIGLLIVRKVRRFTMFLTFVGISLAAFLLQTTLKGLDPISETKQFFVSFPVIFFGAVMLTEPLTTPPTKRLQVIYATLLAILFSWQGSFGPIILTTELVLIFGNVFSFFVSPKYRLFLKLEQSTKLAQDTFEYVFKKPSAFQFRPGQYLEWTLPILKTDSRGNRRYFTIASSPTEDVLKIGIKHNNSQSLFKRHLQKMQKSDSIVASQLLGDFTLPDNPQKKLVFISGGIGVTPFRSMIKYLIDKNEKRDIVFFYSSKTEGEIAYRSLFDEASQKLGINVVYILSDDKSIPTNWNGERGRITEEILRKHVKNLEDRKYYLSGPNAMVENYKKLLRKIKIKPTDIVTDYFPGF